MEWHSESAAGFQPNLANLGEMYLERFDLHGNYDDPIPPPAQLGETPLTAPRFGEGTPGPKGITGLRLSASVRHAITGRHGTQTLSVYVDDQRQQPVQGASVAVVARYPSNRQQVELGPTAERGFVKDSFEILPAPQGERVIIDVTVTYEGLEETTQTFFLP